ncbi:M20 family metallopeptidase [Desulforhopalus sp. 52FAK]
MNTVEDQTRLIDLTKELIRIPSTHSSPAKIQECSHLIQSWLGEKEIQCSLVEHNDVPSILVLPTTNHTPVLLVSHFDVVEAENSELFTPKVKNGSLYGRGSIDDKYGVALSLTLFDQHLRRLKQGGRFQDAMGFGLLITGDEEVGGANGAAKAIDHFSTDFFITLDGGNPDLIVTKEKGSILIELNAEGTSAHAARPWLGESAFDILTRDYIRIKELFIGDPLDHWKKTLSLTQCSAGTCSTNMLPGSARALLDIRYTEKDDPDEIIRLINDATVSTIDVKALEPVFSSGKSPYLDQLIDCSKGAKIGREHGASDARYLSGRGIPGVVWGADGEMSQHTEDEHLVISSLFDIYDRLDRFLINLNH